MAYVIPCLEDHAPPPDFIGELPQPIGNGAGFACYALFIALGGFGCPSTIQDQIRALNTSYQTNTYLPKHREALSIWAWLNDVHEYEDQSVIDAEIAAKCERLNEIDAEINAAWATLRSTVRALIPDACVVDFIAWRNGL